jgi:hypothetical protein
MLRRPPETVMCPTAMHEAPPHDSPDKSMPVPAFTAGAEVQVLPFQARKVLKKPMQLAGLPHVISDVQAQSLNPAQRVPRSGDTSVHVFVAASQVAAIARLPLAISENAPPAAMQKLAAQPTAFIWAGLPFLGGGGPPQALPFQNKAVLTMRGSWSSVAVPTATQFLPLPHET